MCLIKVSEAITETQEQLKKARGTLKDQNGLTADLEKLYNDRWDALAKLQAQVTAIKDTLRYGGDCSQDPCFPPKA